MVNADSCDDDHFAVARTKELILSNRPLQTKNMLCKGVEGLIEQMNDTKYYRAAYKESYKMLVQRFKNSVTYFTQLIQRIEGTILF